MKVTVRRVEAGVAAASTLLMATGAGTVGCAEDTQGSEEYGLNNEALNPGSGQIELQLGNPGTMNAQLTSSTTDEFVRVGEALKVQIPGWLLWETLYPNDPVPTDDARLKKLKMTLKVSFVDKTKVLSTKSLSTSTWTGTQYGLEAASAQFIVPAKTDLLKLTLTVKDAADATKSATLSDTQLTQIPVFGGALPDKSLLLDNNNGTLRQRVVDGDLLVKGSTVSLGYTDWRADQVVDKSSLNLQIGTAVFNGRFGQTTAPIYGAISYEVSYAVSFDGGQTFAAEKALTANTASRLVGAGRTAFEATQVVSKTATQMLLYAHVKAYMIADYSKYTNVSQQWYANNQQILLKDGYDNPSGAYSNYVFQLQ
jgi:hypothetical protein